MSANTAPGRRACPRGRAAPARPAGSPGVPSRRQVVRVARVLRRRHVRGRIADQPFVAEPAGHQLLECRIRSSRRRRASRCRIASNARSLTRYSFSDAWRCVSIARSSQTAANRCTRSPDETTSTPACRTSSTVPASTREMYGNRAIGRVLHRDAPQPRDERPQAVDELLAAGVPLGRARQVCERVTLDRVDEAARLADGGNQVVPAPGREMAALMGDRRSARRRSDSARESRRAASRRCRRPPAPPGRPRRRIGATAIPEDMG